MINRPDCRSITKEEVDRKSEQGVKQETESEVEQGNEEEPSQEGPKD